MAIIGSLMKTDMVTVKPDDSVAEASRAMAQNQVGAVLVVEGETLQGILSERDVVARVVAEGKDPANTKVSEVATQEVVDVEIEAPIRKCVELQLSKGIRHLPVTDGGKPIGVLSSRDFLAYVVEGLERVIDQSRYEQKLSEGDDPYDHIGGSYGK